MSRTYRREPAEAFDARPCGRSHAQVGSSDARPRSRSDRKGYYRANPCADVFTCKVCGRPVGPVGAGSGHRNHCPNCLASVHLDERPGDRASGCHGVMDPIAVWVRKGGEWAVIHRCRICGKLGSNRIAADDNPMRLMALAMRPWGSEAISRVNVRNMTRSMGLRGR